MAGPISVPADGHARPHLPAMPPRAGLAAGIGLAACRPGTDGERAGARASRTGGCGSAAHGPGEPGDRQARHPSCSTRLRGPDAALQGGHRGRQARRKPMPGHGATPLPRRVRTDGERGGGHAFRRSGPGLARQHPASAGSRWRTVPARRCRRHRAATGGPRLPGRETGCRPECRKDVPDRQGRAQEREEQGENLTCAVCLIDSI